MIPDILPAIHTVKTNNNIYKRKIVILNNPVLKIIIILTENTDIK